MRFLSLFLFLVAPLLPATITYSSTCSSRSQTVTSSAAGCSLGDGVGYGTALASASFGVSGNTISLDGNVTAEGRPGTPPPGGFYQPFSASASVTVTADLFTTGPVRQGYVEILTQIQTQNHGVGGALSNQSLGSALNQQCPVNQFCLLTAGQNNMRPFQLGSAFTFSDFETASGQSDYVESLGSGSESTVESFLFFEADGVTPVSLYEVTAAPHEAVSAVVPEPSSLGFAGLGLVAITAMVVRAKR